MLIFLSYFIFKFYNFFKPKLKLIFFQFQNKKMKVLIVNCFKRNNEGRKLYKAFYKLIVKVYYLSLF